MSRQVLLRALGAFFLKEVMEQKVVLKKDTAPNIVLVKPACSTL